MESSILVTIAIFLLVQSGGLIWILSDLTTRAKITGFEIKNISDFLSGLENKYATSKEMAAELRNIKDSLKAAHDRLDNSDNKKYKNWETEHEK